MKKSVSTLKLYIVTTELETNAALEVANKYLQATTVMVVMDPYKAKALMRFNATVFLDGLSPKANTLIGTTTYLNFICE
jgi:uncharacterized protein (DUF302 family)